jgi:hypothetical protein
MIIRLYPRVPAQRLLAPVELALGNDWPGAVGTPAAEHNLARNMIGHNRQWQKMNWREQAARGAHRI